MDNNYRRPQPDNIYYPDPKKCDHDRNVLVDRQIHAITAERLRSNPQILDDTKKRLERWLADELREGGLPSRALLDWKKILFEKSLDEIIQVLLAETQDADRLRSSSPFCVLTNEECLAIIKANAPVPA